MKWIAENLRKVRERKPLVQNITNFVVMNTTANALLAIGASPVMAHAKEELEDMLRIANALVVNIGTLDEWWISSMEKAVRIAGKLNRPVVLDPVGAGATRLRTQTALRILEAGGVTILRGNFGEIKALLGEHGKTRGVDSTGYDREEALNLALTAAKEFNTTIAVTGPIDYISNGKKVFVVENGHPMLGKVTGTGCIVTALMGAFVAIDDPLRASTSALTVFGIVAEKAYEEAHYPGSFHVKLYDWLYRVDGALVEEKARVREIEP